MHICRYVHTAHLTLPPWNRVSKGWAQEYVYAHSFGWHSRLGLDNSLDLSQLLPQRSINIQCLFKRQQRDTIEQYDWITRVKTNKLPESDCVSKILAKEIGKLQL